MASENPYQPPTTEQCLSERLVFDGVIDQADYFELYTQSSVERFGWSIFESSLLTIILPPVLTAGVYQYWHQSPWQLYFTGLAFPTLVAGLFVLQRTLSRRAIVRRELAHHPDLLGVAQGELSADGFLFYDGVHHYWFGPYLLSNCIVTRHGVRIQTDSNPFRYLALTRRLFRHYDYTSARRLLRSWLWLGVEGKLPSLSLWNQLGEAPSEAIHFRFETQDIPRRAPPLQPQNSRTQAVLSLLFMGLAIAATWNSVGRWLLLFYIAIWPLTMLIIFVQKRLASRLPSPTTIQHNWITQQEFATHNNHAGMRVPTHRLKLAVLSDDKISGELHGRTMEIERAMLVDPNQWVQLCALVAALPKDS